MSDGQRMNTSIRTAFGQSENIGIYALAAAANDLYAKGGEDVRVSIRLLLPPDGQNAHRYAVEKRMKRFCQERGIGIDEMCAWKSAGASQYLAIVTGVSLAPKEQEWYRETMRAGQDIVLVNEVGIEGMLRLMDEREAELKKRFAPVFLAAAEQFRDTVFAADAIRTAKAAGAEAVRQVGEGGIFAALWRLSEESGMGLETDLKRMPVRQETIEICEYFRLNPYQLASAGSFLMLASRGEALVDALLREGIEASVIGNLTEGHDKIIRNGGERRCIDRPAPDEFNKIFMEDLHEGY